MNYLHAEIPLKQEWYNLVQIKLSAFRKGKKPYVALLHIDLILCLEKAWLLKEFVQIKIYIAELYIKWYIKNTGKSHLIYFNSVLSPQKG